MTEAVVVAVIGLIAGAVGSLAAPWAQWGVEKRRETRQHRRDLIKSWRDGLNKWEQRDERMRSAAETLHWYSSLAPHMDPEKRKTLEGPRIAVVSGNRMTGDGSLIQKEIDRIEKDWGLQ